MKAPDKKYTYMGENEEAGLETLETDVLFFHQLLDEGRIEIPPFGIYDQSFSISETGLGKEVCEEEGKWKRGVSGQTFSGYVCFMGLQTRRQVMDQIPQSHHLFREV